MVLNHNGYEINNVQNGGFNPGIDQSTILQQEQWNNDQLNEVLSALW